MIKIETPRLLLRSVDEGDAHDIFEYSKNPVIGLNAGWKPHETIDDTLEFIRMVFAGQAVAFGIALPESDMIIGTLGLTGDPKREFNGARMLGYSLAREFWGRGIMTEAVAAVIDYSFHLDGIELISAYCYPHKTASQRVIEKNGFSYEGRLARAELLYNGQLLDHLCFSLSREAYFNR